MSASARRREIFTRVLADGYVDAKTLSAALGVDSSTIRRDLDALARDGRVERTHGGAKAIDGASFEVPYALKQDVRRAEKSAIASVGAALVSDGDSVILDSGSTTYEVAVALREKSSLTVLTNDLRIAKFVASFPDVRLLVSGGELLGSVYTLIGDHAVRFMSHYSADWAFLGADAIDPAAGITNNNTLEVPIKRALIAAAAHTVVVADHAKFGRRALAKVAALDEVNTIVTDSGLDGDQRELYGDALMIADVPPAS
ncbi:DeoR/GlpR family DNA-binding transcription regulator [Rhodococcus sp. SJ-3]|uniref:DeoR/GlpR family DNA-binding transcription regulator n=1 Tax=Rhodococcus sp. SJ-3 TaxID=3454628 RepID=UPI003F78C41F